MDNRWRSGNTNTVEVVPSAPIDPGTLVYLSRGQAWPMQVDMQGARGEWDLQNACLLTHERLRAFLGVVMATTPRNMLRVATTGVFEFDCIALKKRQAVRGGVFEVGDTLGIIGDHTLCYSPLIETAIARVAVRCPSPSPAVHASIRSRVMGYSV